MTFIFTALLFLTTVAALSTPFMGAAMIEYSRENSWASTRTIARTFVATTVIATVAAFSAASLYLHLFH